MLATAFTSIGSSFPSRFVLGQFFPAFTAVTVNLLLAAAYFPSWEARLAALRTSLDLTELAAVVGALAFLAAALAFTLSPLLDVLRQTLEGELLPRRIRRILIEDYRDKATVRRAQAGAVSDYAQELSSAIDSLKVKAPSPPAADPPDPGRGWIDRLIERCAKWLGLSAAPGPAAPAPVVPGAQLALPIPDLQAAAAQRLQEMEAAFEPIEAEPDQPDWDANAAAAAVEATKDAALALTELRRAYGQDKPDEAFRQLVMRFRTETASARRVAARELSKRKSVQRLESAPDDPRPTRFGNLRAALEHYPQSAYGVSFSYLWPRVQLVIGKDDAAATVLGEARTQLDYTLTGMLLVMLSCVGWLLILAVTAEKVAGFVLLGAATLIAFWTFYQISLAAQRNLAEATRAALDRYRFAVLTMLHVALPKDGDAERASWRQLQTASAGVIAADPVGYVHAP